MFIFSDHGNQTAFPDDQSNVQLRSEKLYPVQITLPAQQDSGESAPRVLTIQVPESAIAGWYIYIYIHKLITPNLLFFFSELFGFIMNISEMKLCETTFGFYLKRTKKNGKLLRE